MHVLLPLLQSMLLVPFPQDPGPYPTPHPATMNESEEVRFDPNSEEWPLWAVAQAVRQRQQWIPYQGSDTLGQVKLPRPDLHLDRVALRCWFERALAARGLHTIITTLLKAPSAAAPLAERLADHLVDCCCLKDTADNTLHLVGYGFSAARSARFIREIDHLAAPW